MIGILGFQGSFWEHKSVLDKMNIKNIIVKNSSDLLKIDKLIIPGGESTSMTKFIDKEMKLALNKFINIDKKKTLGTCAGIIILSDLIENESNKIIGGLNITINRNYYGSQNDSFIKNTHFKPLNITKNQMYIRAPFITKIGSDVEIIAKYDDIITGVRQDNIMGLTFHPELVDDIDFYKYFLFN
ncbi:SNO glutamine amidotransferase family [seawater metagenome]|uniref:SNO glutamine amidotransferase family n=1 Tax=seawater metagenome TaxID=1561972 RepID=A0A5E8CJ18_9ZZZZ